MKKIFFFITILLGSVICWLAVDQYLFCPQFIFKAPVEFSGDSIYNPYENFVSKNYVKSNFHAHSKFGLGITNGAGTSKDIWDKYRNLGYVFHSVSQYQHIDKFGVENKNYIPSYEHGYNINKTHQLLLGGKNVVQKDYIFPQNIHQKQYVLAKLAEDTSNVIVLNHPDLNSGYSLTDLKYLQYYDCIEVLNPSAQSFAHWDIALSAGKKVFIVGNDDLHDINNKNQIARFTTLVNSPNHIAKEAITSLKIGSSIAMWLPQIHNESMDDKKKKFDASKITLDKIGVEGDKIVIKFTESVLQVNIIGQNGKILYSGRNKENLEFPFTKEDTYLRVEYKTNDGIQYFLNPLFRYKSSLDSRNFAGLSYVSRKPIKLLEGGFLYAGWILFVFVWVLRKKLNTIFSFFSKHVKVKAM